MCLWETADTTMARMYSETEMAGVLAKVLSELSKEKAPHLNLGVVAAAGSDDDNDDNDGIEGTCR